MLAAFLMAFPALFSIVNPVAGALIFRGATDNRTHEERKALARRIGVYALIVMLVALGAGSYVLALFGISIAALRIGGGLVVALFAWELLNAPEKQDGRKKAVTDALPPPIEDVAFFPLTLPFTTGPGTIAVAVTLGSEHPDGASAIPFFAGLTAAAMTLAVVIAAGYTYADRMAEALGHAGNRTITRLSAFLMFCIGVQLLISGATDVLDPMLRR